MVRIQVVCDVAIMLYMHLKMQECMYDFTCICYVSFLFGQKPGNSDLLMALSRRFLSPAFSLLAYQNREQLPVYTCLPKPRTITRLDLLNKTANNYPFVRVIVRGFHQHYPFKRVIKTGNNYRPCGVWSSTLTVYTGNCRRLLEQCSNNIYRVEFPYSASTCARI
jgi:hypothetical protein